MDESVGVYNHGDRQSATGTLQPKFITLAAPNELIERSRLCFTWIERAGSEQLSALLSRFHPRGNVNVFDKQIVQKNLIFCKI